MKSRKGQEPGNRTQLSLHARTASIVICPAHGHFPQMSGLCIKTHYSPRLMAGSDVMVAWCCDSCVVLTMTGVLRELEPEQSVPRSPLAISRVTAPTAAHCQCREREISSEDFSESNWWTNGNWKLGDKSWKKGIQKLSILVWFLVTMYGFIYFKIKTVCSLV